jgi:hypothetical protein
MKSVNSVNTLGISWIIKIKMEARKARRIFAIGTHHFLMAQHALNIEALEY